MKIDDNGWAFVGKVIFVVAGGYLVYKMATFENYDKTLDDCLEELRKSEQELDFALQRLDEDLEEVYKAQGGKRIITDPDLNKSLERLDKALEIKGRFKLEFETVLKKMNITLENGREKNAKTD